MIFSNTSNYMLKYQKAKAKLVEYDIPQNHRLRTTPELWSALSFRYKLKSG